MLEEIWKSFHDNFPEKFRSSYEPEDTRITSLCCRKKIFGKTIGTETIEFICCEIRFYFFNDRSGTDYIQEIIQGQIYMYYLNNESFVVDLYNSNPIESPIITLPLTLKNLQDKLHLIEFYK